MFSSGANALRTPSSSAVPGINCINPCAPARETARVLPLLSAFTTLASRSVLMLCRAPARASRSPISAGVSGAETVRAGSSKTSGRAGGAAEEGGAGGSGICSTRSTELAATSM
jgi:hypothetical protein